VIDVRSHHARLAFATWGMSNMSATRCAAFGKPLGEVERKWLRGDEGAIDIDPE
jgi:hypothetical protein